MDETEAILRKRLRSAYSEATIEHILHPHNTERIEFPDGYAGCRSSCGENMKIWLTVKNQIVQDAGFWTDGCAATVACGSMATDLIQGRTVTKAMNLAAHDIADALEDLPEGNLHCAELAARTVKAALMDCVSMRRQPWKKMYRK
jgi:NifU-like protein involved in Fe-S cluster formation